MIAALWRSHGLRPAWLLDELTPFEVNHLFGEKVKPPKSDPVGDLHELNHVTRAGRPPKVPTWILNEVPRRGRPEPGN